MRLSKGLPESRKLYSWFRGQAAITGTATTMHSDLPRRARPLASKLGVAIGMLLVALVAAVAKQNSWAIPFGIMALADLLWIAYSHRRDSSS